MSRRREIAEGQRPPGLPREIHLIALIGFLSAIGLGLVVPSLPSLGNEYSVGVAAMTVAISGFAAARLATNVALTRLLQRVPLRPVLAFGLAFQGATTIVAGLAPDYGLFITFRILSGIGSAAYTIASTALMVAVSPPERRGRAASLQGGANGIGTVAGPALGGVVALTNTHLPLIVYGIGLTLGSFVTIVLLRHLKEVRTIDRQAADAADPEGVVVRRWREVASSVLADRMLLTVLVCQAVNGWVYYGTRTSILPAYLESVGVSAGFVGVLLAVAAAAQLGTTATAGPVSDRLGRFPILVVSYVAGVLAFTTLFFAANPITAVVGFAALGLAGGAQQSTATALLADSPRGHSALGAGLFWITFDVFAIIGPTVSGLVGQSVGTAWVLAMALAILVAALMNAVRMLVRNGRRDLPQPV